MLKKEKNYYETLDVSNDASPEEIQVAYARAMALYGDGSLAVYSLFSEEEKSEKLNELRMIVDTLSDPVRRKSYDNSLRDSEARPGPATDIGGAAGKDVFTEYAEAGAFRDKISLRQPLAVMEGRNTGAAEKYRMLYAKLEEISLRDSVKTLAITSAVKGEGKTMTAMNLSYVMAAEFRKKVLLIEGDLRNPAISSSYLNLSRLPGLVDVLKGDSDVNAAISRLDDTSLYFLPARCSVRNSSEYLDSPAMKNLLNRVKNEFDFIMIDSPPVLPVVDVNILAKSVDRFMFVVRAERTPKDLVIKAAKSLPPTHIAGIVLNGADEDHPRMFDH